MDYWGDEMFLKNAIVVLLNRIEHLDLTDEERCALVVLEVWRDLGCPLEKPRREAKRGIDQAGDFFK